MRATTEVEENKKRDIVKWICSDIEKQETRQKPLDQGNSLKEN